MRAEAAPTVPMLIKYREEEGSGSAKAANGMMVVVESVTISMEFCRTHVLTFLTRAGRRSIALSCLHGKYEATTGSR